MGDSVGKIGRILEKMIVKDKSHRLTFEQVLT